MGCVATGTPIIQMPLWCQGGGGVDLREWPTYDVELLIEKRGLAGQTFFAGIDLAWTTDMAALALLFPPFDDSEQWRVLLFFWLPAERISDIERHTRAPLTSWVETGFLETTSGAEIDMNVIIERIRWASQVFDLEEVTFDRWGGIKAAANLLLVPEGLTCVEIPSDDRRINCRNKTLPRLIHEQEAGSRQ